MLLPKNTTIHSLVANVAGKVKLAFDLFYSKKTRKGSEQVAPTSSLLHPDLSYAHTFGTAAGGLKARTSGIWLATSLIAVGMSTFMNYIGYQTVFPNKPVAALMLALMLEAFVVGTGTMIKRASRAALPWLVVLAVLVAGTSVETSIAGMNQGAVSLQQSLNQPRYEHEDATKEEGVFAAAVARTQNAAIGRITNEFSFFAKHNISGSSLESGFARDRANRISDLDDLKARWTALDFSRDFAGAKSTDQIWKALQHEYAALQPLVAETNKLTSGQSIPMPSFPVAPDHAAADAHSGENDVTGMNSLRHPSLAWFFIIPLALIMDVGPMLAAGALREIDKGEIPAAVPDGVPEPEDPQDSPMELHDDWDERERRMRRVGDDLRVDPLAQACDSAIHASVESYRFVERGALENLTLMRAFEIFGEQAAILRDAAVRFGIRPEAVHTHLEEEFTRLQKRLRQERQIQDGEQNNRFEKRQCEQQVQGTANKLALAKQIMNIQAELDALSGGSR